MNLPKMPLVIDKIISPLIKALLPVKVRWEKYENDYPKNAILIKSWGKRFSYLILAYFLLWLVFLRPIPTITIIKELETRNATEIYSDDNILMGRYFIQARTSIPADSIPGFVFHALVAIEDKRFFSHQGVDLKSWGRVLVRTVLGGDESGGGGSTLSQQLAKNLFPREKFLFLSLIRNKLKEIIIANRLERVYTKMELLTLYLNTVPFSENVYGIEVASKRFFSKSPIDLTIQEAAALMGTLKANTSYNPRKATEKVRIRRNLVLQQMVENKQIKEEIIRLSPVHKKNMGNVSTENLSALLQSPLIIRYNPIIKNEGIAPYFQIHVKKELDAILSKLKKDNGQPYNIDIDGLKVYTTLDTRLQRHAEEAMLEHLSYLQKNYTSQWKNQPIQGEDEAIELMKTQSLRYKQLKLKGYSENAIKKDFDTPIPMVLFNYDGEEDQVMMSPLDSLRYYFRILQVGFVALDPSNGNIKSWIGGVDFTHFKYDHVLSRRQTGSVFKPLVYTAALLNGRDPCEQIPNEPSIGLGAAEISLLEMVSAFSVYPNLGTRHTPRGIKKIVDGKGEIIYQAQTSLGNRVITSDTALIVLNMLQSVATFGTASRLRWQYGLENKPIAGKTGTSQFHADGWFIGFNPKLIAGAWVGGDSRLVRFRNFEWGQGAATALPVWGKFMQRIYADSTLTWHRIAYSGWNFLD